MTLDISMVSADCQYILADTICIERYRFISFEAILSCFIDSFKIFLSEC